jgi:Protein of unknown function (DUF4231)
MASSNISQVNASQSSEKQLYTDLINSLELSDFQKHALIARWLDQVLWMGGRAKQSRNSYYTLRLIAIVSGVIVPALVSVTATGTSSLIIRWATFILSLAVALSTAVEEFFHYGDRWRNYRRTTEMLKMEGWQFFELSGPYQSRDSHSHAFPKFTGRVEEIIQRDLQIYISEIVSEKEGKAPQGEKELENP